jgi:hypothetical protein
MVSSTGGGDGSPSKHPGSSPLPPKGKRGERGARMVGKIWEFVLSGGAEKL